MRCWRKLFGVLILASATGVSFAATILVNGEVTYLASSIRETAIPGCDWEKGIPASVLANARNVALAPVGESRQSPFHMSLQVVHLRMKSSGRSTVLLARVRADVRYDNKLVATQDFDADDSVRTESLACKTIEGLASSLGEDIAEWVANSRFAECPNACVGIHPDEPIVVGAEVFIDHQAAINDTVRNECNWNRQMVTKLVSAFNQSDPVPRARLEQRSVDIAAYSGRRLLLYVDNIHALGGGGWTGPKWMAMRGELRDGDLLVGTFESYTSSGRGLTTCRSVDALSESSAELIAQWLRSPTLGAKLK